MNYRARRYVAHASLTVSLLMPLASSDCSTPASTGGSHGKHQCYFGTKYHKKGHYHKTSAGKVWVPKGCH